MMQIRQTFFALRAGLVALVVLLFAAVALEILGVDCHLGSISAYYFTPVRSIFVGTLCAIGAILMIYRGNTDTENMLFNFSGFFAFLLAVIPTKRDVTCPRTADVADLAAQVSNNVWAVLAIGLVAVAFSVLVESKSGDGLSKNALMALTVSGVALSVGVALFVFNRELVMGSGHAASALGFFALIIAAVWANALDLGAEARGFKADTRARAARDAARNRYGIVAIVMTLSTLIGVPLVLGNGELLFWLESVLIIEFAVFWYLQTRELRGEATRAAARAAR